MANQPSMADAARAEMPDIRATACPTCRLCGAPGRELYHELRDRLFSAPGRWTMRQCPDWSCGLLWLDPMPLPEDLFKAYARYYTHQASENTSPGVLQRAWRRLKAAYLAERYGYSSPTRPVEQRTLAGLMYLLPLRRREVEASVRYLPRRSGGRVLDVGCGSGDWLARMRALGWEVQGLDFDAAAVQVARERGLDVRLGSLEEQGYASASFDAVTLNHVIEHVPDPIATLSECHRILRVGGTLVLATPNALSLSHRVFRADWRGLEPPRHLHVFTPASLRRALERAGFKRIGWQPQIAFSVVFESLLLRRDRTTPFPPTQGLPVTRALAHLFNLWELIHIQSRPELADCMAFVADKNASTSSVSDA